MNFSHQLQEFVQFTKRIAQGDWEATFEASGNDEFSELALSFEQIISSLKQVFISKDYLEGIIDSISDILIITDLHGVVKRSNHACQKSLDLDQEKICDKNIIEFFPKDVSSPAKAFDETMLDIIVNMDFERNFESEFLTYAGDRLPVIVSHSKLYNFEDDGYRYVFLIHDISNIKEAETEVKKSRDELEKVYQELKENQSMLIQSEKMAGLGQMAAGVAHEINNPIGFVTSNINSLGDYLKVFKEAFEKYALLEKSLKDQNLSEDTKEILSTVEKVKNEGDLDFILDDIDNLVQETIDGAVRVKNIVQGLKSFVRLDEGEIKDANINELIQSTLKIASNQIKYKAELELALGDLPAIICYPAQLNQVFLNIIVNAAQAIEEKGKIKIQTQVDQDSQDILVQIADTGLGIPEDKLKDIFTPFYTTKAVGSGTGLGLSISHGIIKKHNGDIQVVSQLGKGTTFTIRLPFDCREDTSIDI